jgi:hypothetical protein
MSAQDEINEFANEFARGLLKERLAQCTVEQQEFFKLLYPNGVEDKNLALAIDQCTRTIKKNKEKTE